MFIVLCCLLLGCMVLMSCVVLRRALFHVVGLIRYITLLGVKLRRFVFCLRGIALRDAALRFVIARCFGV